MKYPSVDSGVELENVVHYLAKFLHILNLPGIPTHNLCFKIITLIMLLRNLIPLKLYNGTRLQDKTLH